MMKHVTKKKARGMALQVVRELLRMMDIPPEIVDASETVVVLDEVLKKQPQSVTAQWWRQADERERGCFCAEWEDWRKPYLRLCPFCGSSRENEELVFCQTCEDFLIPSSG